MNTPPPPVRPWPRTLLYRPVSRPIQQGSCLYGLATASYCLGLLGTRWATVYKYARAHARRQTPQGLWGLSPRARVRGGSDRSDPVGAYSLVP